MIVEGGVGTEWLIEYHRRRSHETPAYMTPIEFNEKCQVSGMDSSCTRACVFRNAVIQC